MTFFPCENEKYKNLFNQTAVQPPSTAIASPLISEAESEQRNNAVSPIYSGRTN